MSLLIQLRDLLARSHTRSILWLEVDDDQPATECSIAEILGALGQGDECTRRECQTETQTDKQSQHEFADSLETILISDRALNGIAPVRAGEFVRHLGESYSLILFDCFAGLNPATLAQAIGTLRGGGLFVLITPKAALWPTFDDPEYRHLGLSEDARLPGRFIRYLISALEHSDAVVRFTQLESLPERPPRSAMLPVGCFLGSKQQAGVYRLLASWRKSKSCTVLSADRGRGKSSTLGIALALQASFQTQQLQIVAPDKRALVSLLQRLRELLGDPDIYQIITPAQLMQQIEQGQSTLRCVIVDEAAALAVPLLERIAEAIPHVVFASTLNGYEGFAQGYGLRFLRQLAHLRPETLRLELAEPLRWATGDPLEAWSNQHLLLDEAGSCEVQGCGFIEVDRTELVKDRALLATIYRLLAQAHYRTSPSDLRVLLDAPQQRLFVEIEASQVVAVLWVVEEGPIEVGLAQQIMQGRRRPKGNLLPQVLLHYLGWEASASQRFWRVVRVAVAEPFRRQGRAAAMLRKLQERAVESGIDFIGASFAGHSDLQSFWRASGFERLRQGEQIDPVAAAPAIQVLRPLNSDASIWLQRYTQDRPGEIDMVQAGRDRLALHNFAYHFAPLSLVRSLLSNLSLSAQSKAMLERDKLSSAELKQLRAEVRELV